MAGQFVSGNIPTPQPKPTNYSAGSSIFDTIFDGLTNTFNSYIAYDNATFWRDWQADQVNRTVQAQQDLQTATLQNQQGSGLTTNGLLMIGLIGGGFLLLAKAL